jgi:hypothetical protein
LLSKTFIEKECYVHIWRYIWANARNVYIHIWSPMNQGRCVCVCVCVWRYMVHTFTRETYLLRIIWPWCSIFWYLVIKIIFYVLSFSISTSSFVLVVGIIFCDKVYQFTSYLNLCVNLFCPYKLFFVSLPAKTSLGRGGWGKKEIPISYWRESFSCQILGQKSPVVVLNWFLWCHGPEVQSWQVERKNMAAISSRYLSILRGNLFSLF